MDPFRNAYTVVAPPRRRLSMVWSLVLVNIAMFVVLNVMIRQFETQRNIEGFRQMSDVILVSYDSAVGHWRVWTLLTSAIAHISTLHLFFNMYVYWMITRDIEKKYGPLEVLALYLASAVASSLAFVIHMHLIGHDATPALGASGVVTAMLVLFAMNWPNRVFLLWGIIPMRSLSLVILYVLLDIFGMSKENSGVGHAAHLGGAAFGFVYWWSGKRLTKR